MLELAAASLMAAVEAAAQQQGAELRVTCPSPLSPSTLAPLQAALAALEAAVSTHAALLEGSLRAQHAVAAAAGLGAGGGAQAQVHLPAAALAEALRAGAVLDAAALRAIAA